MRIHFIGIGGIGLSGLARYFHRHGHRVTGSDILKTSLIQKLIKEGIPVKIPQIKENIDQFKPDLVVYTAVIKPDNPELQRARELGIPTLSRREFLPYLVKNKEVLAVCGAHGKSTTTAILASLLPESNAIVGAISKEFNSNCRVTNSPLLVFEADESDGSFVDTNPTTAVVTNAEPEHMEFYNYNFNLFFEHYRQFLQKATHRIVNGKDQFLNGINLEPIEKVILEKEVSNIQFQLRNNLPKTLFTYRGVEFEIYGFGEYLVLDALLAIKAGEKYLPLEQLSQNIKNYRGIKKRFDIVADGEEYLIIDDYGHHPTEIEKTLQSAFRLARLRGLKGVTAIWQPHKYSRTIDNLDRFVECFAGVDQLIILPVWGAGESPRPIDFPGKFKRYNPIFAPRVYRTEKGIEVNGTPFTSGVIIGFGAGDITYQLRGEI
jgi:UDP-N-acetylmuramate--alanine ligase